MKRLICWFFGCNPVLLYSKRWLHDGEHETLYRHDCVRCGRRFELC